MIHDLIQMLVHWPAFNLADSAICLGVFLYVAFNLKKARQRPWLYNYPPETPGFETLG
jgi:lipoprotein signal peptidase